MKPSAVITTSAARRRWFQLGCAALLPCALAARARAEDHVDYRYEYYKEEDGRIEVNTHSVAFEKKLVDAVAVRGQLVYDAISGATPTGGKPAAGKDAVPTTKTHDIRRGGNLAFDVHLGRHTLAPQVAYSKESDYESTGVSLSDAIEFNNKNTTLNLGISHDFDNVLDSGNNLDNRQIRHKDTTDGLIGISQLLSPKTIFTANFTYGVSDGYLNDPYKSMSFGGWIPYIGFPLTTPGTDKRPDHRERQVLQLTLSHFFDKVNGSGEVSYRFGHDSFGVFSHTATLNWHQKIGKHVVLSPVFRFYEQSAANFYTLLVPGFAPNDGDTTRPEFYSADYRLSHLMSFTYGLQASIFIKEWITLDLGYHRYEMYGLDSATSASAYPKANIYTVGLRVFF